MYEWRARSGVRVRSCVPREPWLQRTWWATPFASWLSWTRTIIKSELYYRRHRS